MWKRVGLTSVAMFVLCLCFLLLGLGRPKGYVLDESVYVVEARALLHRTADSPTHPPLAKMLITAGMELAGNNPFGWRVAGAVSGALTLVAVFLWTYLLLGDYQIALIAAGLTMLNNFLYVMSRVAMLDVFYFMFLMWAVVAFTAALKLEMSVERRRALMLACGVLFGLSGACKWNAVVMLGAVGLVSVILYLRGTQHVREIGLGTLAIALVVLPPVVYWLIFWPFCYWIHRPFTLAEVVAMNKDMWVYHVTVPGNPSVNSRWYSWIFRWKPERAQRYLVGNFVVIWGGFLALLNCGWRFWKLRTLPEGLVVLFYAVNLLQWVIIPQHRTVYYYYYPCAMFLCVAFAMVLGRMGDRRVLGLRPLVIVFLAAAVVFLYCYPRMAALEAPYDCALGCWN
ncbi:MAG: phospholipid carrier-dependent glycosyltransferase [Candidatus Acidiferrum sp.]